VGDGGVAACSGKACGNSCCATGATCCFDDSCAPSGATCCGLHTFCANGGQCCSVANGGFGCAPAGTVCCEDGVFCPSGWTCGGNGSCIHGMDSTQPGRAQAAPGANVVPAMGQGGAPPTTGGMGTAPAPGSDPTPGSPAKPLGGCVSSTPKTGLGAGFGCELDPSQLSPWLALGLLQWLRRRRNA